MLSRALSALVVAALVGPGVGCAPPEAGTQSAPEAAFRAFRDALQRGDRETVFAMLDDDSRAVLEAQAEAWTAAGGDPRPASDFLGVADVLVETEIRTMERVESEGDRAVLELTTWHDTTHHVALERDGDRWRVDLDLDGATDTIHDEVEDDG